MRLIGNVFVTSQNYKRLFYRRNTINYIDAASSFIVCIEYWIRKDFRSNVI